MYCYNCQYFNQCSYKNQLISMPYYYSPSHGRLRPGRDEHQVEMSVLGDEEPDYIPPEPPGGTMKKKEIIRVIRSCKSKWIYIWTKVGDNFWAKIVSHDNDSVTTKRHGTILYDRIRKISCPRPMELDQTPQENNEPLDENEDEYISAERFNDNNCRNCYYYHVCPAIMQTSYSPYFNQCSYRNQLIPMPYYYSPSHGRIASWMEEPPVEMPLFRDEPPNYIPQEPPGSTMSKDKIIEVIDSCKSGWFYIWTEMDTEFWDKIISRDRDSVTTDKHGKILYDRIRKIKCHEAMKKTQIPQENQEPLEEGEEEEVVIAKRFYDNNCRTCYYYHVCPVKMQIPHSQYYRTARQLF